VQPTSLHFPWELGVAVFAACECFLGGSVVACTPNCGGSVATCTPNYGLHASYQEGLMAHRWRCFCLLSLHASGWGPPKFGRAPQIESFKLVCVLIGNKKISRDAKGLFFRFLISKESRRLYKQGVLHLKDELLKKRGVMSWAVGGLMGRLGRPIRVRFRDQIRSYLRVKDPSLCKERRYARFLKR